MKFYSKSTVHLSAFHAFNLNLTGEPEDQVNTKVVVTDQDLTKLLAVARKISTILDTCLRGINLENNKQLLDMKVHLTENKNLPSE
jgi:hypothetical protein